MQEISHRLETLSRYVPPGQRVADIGTDHAYLPVYLVSRGIATRVIAGDIHRGPFLVARENVRRAGLQDQIAVRCGDGLATIAPREVQTVILAGMGGGTIIKILENHPAVTRTINRLVMQPMNDVPQLRRWLDDNDWYIFAEDLVEEDGLIYHIVVAEPTGREGLTPTALEIGPRLLERGHPLLVKILSRQLDKYRHIAGQMAKSTRPETVAKREELEYRIRVMEEVLAKCLSVSSR